MKKLSQTFEVDEKKFNQEVESLMRVKHKNIVRFLGYCADTQGKVCKWEGKNVMAEERQRLLCFEFLAKGSLAQYITGMFISMHLMYLNGQIHICFHMRGRSIPLGRCIPGT